MAELPATQPLPPVRLYRFPGRWGVPSLSPFCVKIEAWLRLAGVPYEAVNVASPRRSPTGKLPFALIGEEGVADSSHIAARLLQLGAPDPDSGLTHRERALGHAVARMLDEHTYFLLLHDRWIAEDGWAVVLDNYFDRLAAPLRLILPRIARRWVRQSVAGQGIGRMSQDQRDQRAVADADALAALLGDRPYLLGDVPRSVDAAAFATLTAALWTPVPSTFKERCEEHPALLAYCERLRDLWFPR